MSPWGKVLLDMKGIQSDKAHGLGRIKSASFAAIKDVLEKGEIIERGDHNSLLEQKGRYYQLYTGMFELS